MTTNSFAVPRSTSPFSGHLVNAQHFAANSNPNQSVSSYLTSDGQKVTEMVGPTRHKITTHEAIPGAGMRTLGSQTFVDGKPTASSGIYAPGGQATSGMYNSRQFPSAYRPTPSVSHSGTGQRSVFQSGPTAVNSSAHYYQPQYQVEPQRNYVPPQQSPQPATRTVQYVDPNRSYGASIYQGGPYQSASVMSSSVYPPQTTASVGGSRAVLNASGIVNSSGTYIPHAAPGTSSALPSVVTTPRGGIITTYEGEPTVVSSKVVSSQSFQPGAYPGMQRSVSIGGANRQASGSSITLAPSLRQYSGVMPYTRQISGTVPAGGYVRHVSTPNHAWNEPVRQISVTNVDPQFGGSGFVSSAHHYHPNVATLHYSTGLPSHHVAVRSGESGTYPSGGGHYVTQSPALSPLGVQGSGRSPYVSTLVTRPGRVRDAGSQRRYDSRSEGKDRGGEPHQEEDQQFGIDMGFESSVANTVESEYNEQRRVSRGKPPKLHFGGEQREEDAGSSPPTSG